METLYLLLIALMVVFVTDITDFPRSMLGVLWHYAYPKRPMPDNLTWEGIHPLLKICECSTCQTWWITLITSICCGWWSLPIMAYCAFLAFMVPVWLNGMLLVRDFLLRMIEAIAAFFCL